MLKIITLKKNWDDFIEQLNEYDFYHTYDYHKLSSKKGEQPVLITYMALNTQIAIPFLIRPIKGSEYYDATSVYGYAGPLSKNITEGFDYSEFYKLLHQFFVERKIVSVFSSLNSYIENQEDILRGIGKIKDLGNVVNIDLTKSIQTQLSSFSKTTRRYINRNKRIFHTERRKSKADILKFIELYYETMSRVNADSHYFFSKDYFFNLINSKSYKVEIVSAVFTKTGEVASSVLMIKTNNKIIQYHLAGTSNKYRYLSPIRLLIDMVRINGTKEGFTYFNLGGGLGSKQDSLFKFKASFSHDFKKFKIWQHIVDEKIYEELTAYNKKIEPSEKTDFFPLYRYKL